MDHLSSSMCYLTADNLFHNPQSGAEIESAKAHLRGEEWHNKAQRRRLIYSCCWCAARLVHTVNGEPLRKPLLGPDDQPTTAFRKLARLLKGDGRTPQGH